MNESIIYGIAWAGVVLLYSYSLWDGNILDFFYRDLNKMPAWISKPLGLCEPCFCFWFGILYSEIFDVKNYFVFVGVSSLIVILYKIILLFYQRQ